MIDIRELERLWPLGWSAFDGEDYAVAVTVAGMIGCELRGDAYEFHYNDKILASDEILLVAVGRARTSLFALALDCRRAANDIEGVAYAYAGGFND